MAKWHNLTTYAYFKDIRASVEAISDESAGALWKALMAHDDGEAVDLSGKNETVRGMFPDMARQSDKIQKMRAKNAKLLIHGVPSGVPVGVPSGVPVGEVVGGQSGAPIPEPIPSPDEYMCIQTDGSEKSVPFIPERTGIFADEAIREKWCRYVSDTRVKNHWSNNPAWLKTLAHNLEEISGGEMQEADALLDYVINGPFGNFFKLNRKTYDKQIEKPFDDVPEDWDKIGGGQ